jgi:tetratricopeptide (TPR) repeat protein
MAAFVLLVAQPANSFAVNGAIDPAGKAVVWLYGASSSFSEATLSDSGGRFHFGGILPGSYTLTVVTTAHSEWRQTIDVGPGSADGKGHVNVQVHIDEAKSLADDQILVSARELSVPESAWKEYAKAEQCLSKHDADAAVVHLERATGIAPEFSAAWNSLGTIAYHAQHYTEAEQDFRKSLAADPNEYAPLVNLGGVLMNLGLYRDSWSFNTLAVSKQPNDALAHSQLGMACLALGRLDEAEAQLREAIRLDPHHFSNPQLLLATIYERERKPDDAAEVLDQFLALHPDFAQAPRIREWIARLRTGR